MEINHNLKLFADTLSNGYNHIGVQPNPKKEIVLIGAHALRPYGQTRQTKDVDVYCNLKDLDALQESELVDFIANKIDMQRAITPKTYQPYGFWFELADTTLDWFTAPQINRIDIDEFINKKIYENENTTIGLPELEALILQKVDAYHPTAEKHALDIFEVMGKNAIRRPYLENQLEQHELASKWNSIVDTYPVITEKLDIRKVA